MPSSSFLLTEMRLNRGSDVPIYVQIKRAIEEMIQSGQLKEGDSLPSEPNLAEALGVSKMTVRQAVSELVTEGLLDRQKGRGTFVCSAKVSIRLPYFVSYTQDMRRRGFVPKTELLEIEEIPASPRQARDLGIEPDSLLIRMVLLRFADELPMVLETAWLVKGMLPGFAERQKVYSSRYEIFEKEYGIYPTRADQTLESVTVTATEAHHLGIPVASPALLIESVLRDQNDRAVEITKSIYRGDRYKVYFQRTRREYA